MVGNMFSGGTGTGGAGTISGSGIGGLNIGAAKGAVFNNASVTPFAAGGVLNGPTIFPMANGGLALGGEAGHEALMPLSRGADGKLGVSMNSESGDSDRAITIVNSLDGSVVDDYLTTHAGEETIVNIMRRNRSELDS